MEKLEQAISDILDTLLGYDRQPDGTFAYEIDADYRDEMDKRTAIKILRSDDPMQTFWEQLDEWYQDCQWTLGEELEKEVRAKLTASDGPYPEGLPGEDGDRLLDVLQELVWFKLPEEHFTKQMFRVNIMIDTGDGNVDYTLNSVHPCWYGAYNEPIDARAGIAWLAKTQGYTKGRLRRVLCKGDMANPNSFLESMRVELANLSSAMSTVTFLVELTLAQLLELNRLIKLQDRNGRQAIWGRCLPCSMPDTAREQNPLPWSARITVPIMGISCMWRYRHLHEPGWKTERQMPDLWSILIPKRYLSHGA